MNGYEGNKDAVQRRLRRIEGQVRGVQKMVDENRYCIDVLTQVSAIRAALDKVAIELMDDHVRHCIIEHESADTRAERADELVHVVSRMLGSR